MEHAKHLFRALFLILVLIILLIGLRYVEKPQTFGARGHFRAANIVEQRLLEVRHGKTGACAECHQEIADKKMAGPHKNVACESCHAPLAEHVSDGQRVAAMPKRKVAALCINCHQKLAGRPASHPQVDVATHLEDVGATWSKEVCYDCHSPHHPTEDF